MESPRIINGSVGNTFQTGNVEIMHGGQWGSVCSNRWDNRDARVVCHQLGFRTGVIKVANGIRSEQGHMWLTNVSCTGIESKIQDCSANEWAVNTCSVQTHAAIDCSCKSGRLCP